MGSNLLQFFRNIINIFPIKNMIILIITFLLFVYKLTDIVTNDDIFVPENRYELEMMIQDDNIPLGSIDIRNITDLSRLFYLYPRDNYSGIEKWNVSHVKNMSEMFKNTAKFYGGISNWDVSNVENMEGMFYGAGIINADLSFWDISKVKNMQYMFAYTTLISKEKVNNWKVSDDVKYYGIFRGTKLEHTPPDWFKLKNEFEIKYYPESKEELIRMLKDENILAGEIDVSKVDNAALALDNVKRYNKSYLNEYDNLLSMWNTIEMTINEIQYSGYGYQKELRIEYLKNMSREYEEKLLNVRKKPFYEELQEPKKLIHDDYPGIEFWNVPDIDKILEKVSEQYYSE